MNKKILPFFLALGAYTSQAQISLDSIFVLPDSIKPFTIDEMYAAMLAYHPIVKQAYLLQETAR